VSDDPGILLDLRGLTLTREAPEGPIDLLRDVDLRIRRGEWLAILGGNGSGKTSLLRWLAGEESPLGGRTGLVFQDPDEGIVAATVAEEVALGRAPGETAGLLEAYGLGGTGGRDPRLLSAGQKQRLAMLVVEAGAPEVWLCDEPTALQDPAQAAWMLARLREHHRRGATVLFATQRREEAELADRLIVFADGRIAAEGSLRKLQGAPVVDALLGALDGAGRSRDPSGSPVAAAGRQDGADETRSPVAEWRGLGCAFPDGGGFAGVELVLRPGDRLGIVGPSGCGKSTLLAAAVGLRRPDRGTVLLGGRPLYARGGRDLDHGAALLAPQFPEYLFTRGTVAEEIALDPRLAVAGAGEVLAAAGLPAEVAGRNPHALSSGQRRRLAVAMMALSGRDLVLLDEPTAALDRAGRVALLRLVERLPAAAALVVAGQDREFMRAAGCRLLVLGAAGLAAA
jgi:energy-coupling factor transporter ATP-binding protein EcfA2